MYKQGVKKALEEYARKSINRNAKIVLIDGTCKDWNTVAIMAVPQYGNSEYAIAGKAMVIGTLTTESQGWKVVDLGHAKYK